MVVVDVIVVVVVVVVCLFVSDMANENNYKQASPINGTITGKLERILKDPHRLPDCMKHSMLYIQLCQRPC